MTSEFFAYFRKDFLPNDNCLSMQLRTTRWTVFGFVIFSKLWPQKRFQTHNSDSSFIAFRLPRHLFYNYALFQFVLNFEEYLLLMLMERKHFLQSRLKIKRLIEKTKRPLTCWTLFSSATWRNSAMCYTIFLIYVWRIISDVCAHTLWRCGTNKMSPFVNLRPESGGFTNCCFACSKKI